MRVVVDTNVFIASFLGQSETIRRVVDACYHQEVQLVSSPPLLEEIRATLRKPYLVQRHGLSEGQINDFLSALSKIADVVPGSSDVRVTTDINDNMLFATALEGEAEYIISGDEKHVVSIGHYQGIVVLRPNEFVKLLEEEQLIKQRKKAA
jgi:putative PIN family toxin of toxin-antitoxin system